MPGPVGVRAIKDSNLVSSFKERLGLAGEIKSEHIKCQK